jgi:hypothetical protein
VAPLAATALGLGLGTSTAGAAVRSRIDTFDFTNRAGATVTCTVESTEDLDSDDFLTVSTTVSGPADCTPSLITMLVSYESTSSGGTVNARVEGDGRSLSALFGNAAPSIYSEHFVAVPACDCTVGYDLRQSK